MQDTLSLLNLPTDTDSKKSSISRQAHIKKIVEALLFVSADPLSLEKIRTALEEGYSLSLKEIRQTLSDLSEEYQTRGSAIYIEEMAGGFMLRTRPELQSYIEKLISSRRVQKLSKASMEVLAIIAYQAPVTRAEIDAIRGVDSSGTVSSLVDRGLIESVGKKAAPGNPTQWGVTKEFLKYFGLKSTEEFIHLVAQGSQNNDPNL